MPKKKMKTKFTPQEEKALKIMGAIGGRAVAAKKGKKYMSELGKKGAKKRWAKKNKSKTQ